MHVSFRIDLEWRNWWVENKIKMPYEEVGFFNQTNIYILVRKYKMVSS